MRRYIDTWVAEDLADTLDDVKQRNVGKLNEVLFAENLAVLPTSLSHQVVDATDIDYSASGLPVPPQGRYLVRTSVRVAEVAPA